MNDTEEETDDTQDQALEDTDKVVSDSEFESSESDVENYLEVLQDIFDKKFQFLEKRLNNISKDIRILSERKNENEFGDFHTLIKSLTKKIELLDFEQNDSRDFDHLEAITSSFEIFKSEVIT